MYSGEKTMAHRGSMFVVTLVLALIAPLMRQSSFEPLRAAAQSASPVAATPVTLTQVPVALPTAVDLGITLPAGIDISPLAASSIDNAGSSTLIRLERVTVPAAG